MGKNFFGVENFDKYLFGSLTKELNFHEIEL